jgi:molecular chaperone HscB
LASFERTDPAVQCWNCKTEIARGTLTCPRCSKVQQLANGATFFDAFDLKPQVDVDLPGLERAYRERSLHVHPDRFSTAQARERRFALEQSTLLNDAYRTLKDRAARAFYLLKLNGLDLSREDAGTQKDMPLPFLEEVMELREALDGHREHGALEAALEMAGEVAVRRSTALADAEAALRQLLAHPDNDSARTEASHALARVRYFSRFLEEVNAMEEEALEG